ncbi:SRPBCC family protein [Streptomyces sp. TLI_185]|uniref:SRPBCC family protein n=1 Tax=Streptomyces sp. TLI_185 TaxID=2485151 RepID=UPI000F4ED3EC|nr:SRPBCC family protein [Streptomyces sp. TLI_185]RPF36616.1 carbon monoxide dehydrogenase subunit G [Streptomyces sp. TLI_185]
MSAIHEEFDVDCRPEDAWAYIIDPSHMPEWQLSAVATEQLDDRPFGLGSRVRVTRHIGRRDIPMTMECTQYEPQRSWTVRGIDGPIRGNFHGEITPLDDGRRTHVTMDLDFEGHGIGKVLLPLVVRPQVRKEMPRNEQLLKDKLEHTTG